jgi:hypothetical protein
VRRLSAFVLVTVAVVGMALVDRAVDDDAPAAPAGARRFVAPVAAPTSSLSSTWYCAGGTAVEGGVADHTVVIANPSDEALHAVLSIYAGTTSTAADVAAVAALPPTRSEVDVPALGRVAVRLADVVQAPFAAALVEVSGGAAVVEHVMAGADDTAAAPCASSASPTWHFATGVTTRDAHELLALFNPFPDDAVVDMHFATPEGARNPQEYEGFIVPGGELVVVDITPVVARHAQVASSIVARTGRLVVDRIQTFDGSLGPLGMDVTLAVPVPRPVWLFPDGQITDGVTETYSVYNPTDEQAEVDLELTLDEPEVNGSVDPIALTVPARGYAQVVLDQDTRVPPGVAHAATVRSANGVPVVVERLLVAVAPAPRRGVAFTTGSPVQATEWVLAAGQADATSSEFVVVKNPSAATIARVDVFALVGGQRLAIRGLADLEVGPAARLAIDVGQSINRADLSLVVVASAPVAVERGLYRVGAPGLSQAIGVPLVARIEPAT